MGSVNNDHARIRRYLRGEMEHEELREFENEMDKDPEFKEEVKAHQRIFKGLEAEVKKEAEVKLNKARNNTSPNRFYLEKISAARPYLAVAALLVVIVGVLTMILWNDPATKNSDELFAEHFQPYANTLTNQTRGANATLSALDSAMHFYSRGDFESALIHLNRVDSKNQNALVEFYKGNAYLASGRPEKAVLVLKKVEGQLPEHYQVQGKWYLALGHLQLENTNKAKQYFSEIATEKDAFYQDKAQKILNEISNSKE